MFVVHVSCLIFYKVLFLFKGLSCGNKSVDLKFHSFITTGEWGKKAK